jgi:nucleotide-binding universal stress UspA family protein
VIRFREREPPERILVSTVGGPHASLALELAHSQALCYESRRQRPATITLFTVVRPAEGEAGLVRAREVLEELVEEQEVAAEIKVTAHSNEFEAIMEEAKQHNLVMVPAPRERLLEQRLFGSTAERLARECPKTVMMVKRYQPVKSWLRSWLVDTRKPRSDTSR